MTVFPRAGNRSFSRRGGNRFPRETGAGPTERDGELWARDSTRRRIVDIDILWKEHTMKILTWAAIAVTALFALMNAGAVVAGDIATGYRVVGAVLAALGLGAAVGLATSQPWGRIAVIAVAAMNTGVSIVALFTDQQGAAIGVVVGGLGVILGALASTETERLAEV
jgi:hypothetical protein